VRGVFGENLVPRCTENFAVVLHQDTVMEHSDIRRVIPAFRP
jgi:hypothetical protein